MQLFTNTQGILSAMITPAVLISACGSLIIATVTRLNRAVDRTREVFLAFAEMTRKLSEVNEVTPDEDAELNMLFGQLDLSIRRARLLQHALARVYWALGSFVATSVAVGIMAVTGGRMAWIPIALALLGVGLLLHASLLLVRESRVALTVLEGELDFLWQRGRSQASPELLKRYRRPAWQFFKRTMK